MVVGELVQIPNILLATLNSISRPTFMSNELVTEDIYRREYGTLSGKDPGVYGMELKWMPESPTTPYSFETRTITDTYTFNSGVLSSQDSAGQNDGIDFGDITPSGTISRESLGNGFIYKLDRTFDSSLSMRFLFVLPVSYSAWGSLQSFSTSSVNMNNLGSGLQYGAYSGGSQNVVNQNDGAYIQWVEGNVTHQITTWGETGRSYRKKIGNLGWGSWQQGNSIPSDMVLSDENIAIPSASRGYIVRNDVANGPGVAPPSFTGPNFANQYSCFLIDTTNDRQRHIHSAWGTRYWQRTYTDVSTAKVRYSTTRPTNANMYTHGSELYSSENSSFDISVSINNAVEDTYFWVVISDTRNVTNRRMVLSGNFDRTINVAENIPDPREFGDTLDFFLDQLKQKNTYFSLPVTDFTRLKTQPVFDASIEAEAFRAELYPYLRGPQYFTTYSTGNPVIISQNLTNKTYNINITNSDISERHYVTVIWNGIHRTMRIADVSTPVSNVSVVKTIPFFDLSQELVSNSNQVVVAPCVSIQLRTMKNSRDSETFYKVGEFITPSRTKRFVEYTGDVPSI